MEPKKITIAQHDGPLAPSEMRQVDGFWWMACPFCRNSTRLDHRVQSSEGRVTISPSLVCECGAHFHVVDGEIRKA